MSNRLLAIHGNSDHFGVQCPSIATIHIVHQVDMHANALFTTLFTISAEGQGGDYSAPTGSYSFDVRDTMDCLEITIFNDNRLEVTESLTGSLILQGGSIPGVTLRPFAADIFITDDDSE